MKSKPAILVLALALLSGCYTVKFKGVDAAGDPGGESFHQWTHSLFWGLVPLGRVNIDQCGQAGIKRMKSQIGGLGLLGYALTGGIWTPMHVKVTCARPGVAAAESEGELEDGTVTDGWPDGL